MCGSHVALGAPAGQPLDRATRVVSRALGVRLLVQAAVACTRRGSRPSSILVGAGVDALHATSMLILAGCRPRYRRLALRNGAVAGAIAAAGVRQGLRGM